MSCTSKVPSESFDQRISTPSGRPSPPVGRISEELVAVGEVLQRGISLVLRLFKHIVEERTKIFDVLLFQETTSWQSSRCGLNRIKLV